MKLIKKECHPAKYFSLYNVLNDEFFLIGKCNNYGIFVGNAGADYSIIDLANLPSDICISISPIGYFRRYSLIVFSPNLYAITIKLRKNNVDSTFKTETINKFITVLKNLGYNNVMLDPYSSGNDILYNYKKVFGCVVFSHNGYKYFISFLQGSLDQKTKNILECIHYPQVKLKDKTILERVGELPNLENRFDELYNEIKNVFNYDFEEVKDTEVDCEIDNNLIIYEK